MNLSETFIRRPVATSLLMFAVALFGVLAYHALPVADLPNIEMPTLSVSASLPGANPDTMASAVATPLERQFTGISGLDSMVSVSSTGNTQITLQFDLDRDIDSAAVDVQTAIAEAMPLLPAGMPSPPSFRKSNPNDFPVIHLNVTSPAMPPWELNEWAEDRIGQRLSMVNGVGQVRTWGSQKYAVRVQVDPNKLAAYQIGINEVQNALQNWNVNLPTGTLYGSERAFNIVASGQLSSAAQYRPIVVAWRNGRPVRLEQIANVIDGVEDDKQMSWLYTREGGRPAINVMVHQQPNSNVVEVTDAVKKVLEELKAQLPPAVQVAQRGDRSKTIRESFHDVQFTMAVALGLVITVIFLFLRNASATLIPALALPFSIIGTFAVMYLLGFSLDNLSMMALILSVGFVVDDAIVMLENIVRHMEHGETPLQAAFNGSKEIGFTIVSMTLSLAAVFIPVLFLGGVLGRLFREFAITISAAILISGLVSISLTPMLCSRLLRSRNENKRGRLLRSTDRFFDGMLHVYDVSLRWVLRRRAVMTAVFFLTVGATLWLFNRIPKGLIPETDTDQMYVTLEGPQGISYYQMAKYTRQVAEILRQDPNVEAFSASIGGSFNTGSNSGRLFVQLKPRKQRELHVTQIIERLRPRMASIPGLRVFLSAPSAIRVGGRMSRSQYQFTLQSPDTAELYAQAQRFEREMARLPALTDVSSDLQIRNPRVNVVIDRDKASALGLNTLQIESALYSAYGPRWASTIYAPNAQYRVLLELLPEYQAHPDLLSLLYFRNNAGRLIPLESFATLTTDAGPLSVNHSGQLPSVTLSFNLRSGASLGDAISQVEELARSLPDTISTSFAGSAKLFQDSLRNLGVLLVVAVGVVYIVLGILYESYVHPLTILSGLPSAGLGALLTLMLFKSDLNIYGFVGLMMLIGIVKKNAIMQIDVALELERKERKPPERAIYEGCLVRFRPIMMTTLSALLGAAPIALGYGAGGEARRPLGLTVVGGLLTSQLVTLYLTPVIYIYMTKFVGRVRARKAAPALAPAGD